MSHEAHGGPERNNNPFEIIVPPSEKQMYGAIDMAAQSIARSPAFLVPGPISYEDFKEHIIAALTRMRFRKKTAHQSTVDFLEHHSIDAIKRHFTKQENLTTGAIISRIEDKK